MAYDSRAREKELLARLEPLFAEAEAKASAPPAQLKQDRFVLTQACKDYVTTRNFHLDVMLRQFETAVIDLEIPFKTQLTELTPFIGKTFAERIKNNGKPSPQAELFCMRVEIEEAAFLNGMKRVVEAAMRRDYLLRYAKILKKHTEDLDVRWQSVIAQHTNYDANEKRIADDIDKVIAEAATEAAAQTSPRGETYVRYLDIALNLPIPLPETLSGIRTIAKGAVGYWRKVTDQFSYRQTLFKEAYRSEVGTTLVLFKEFRSETRKFIDDYNYEKAQKECDAGEAALEELVNVSPAPGQKEDLRLFVNEARLRLRERFNQGKWAWDDFVRKHDRKFFGPIVPQIKDELLSTSAWQERKRRMYHMNLHAMLTAWRDDNRHLKLLEIANLGGEAKQMTGYIVEEMVALKSALDATIKAVHELERLNEARERDTQSLE